MRLCVPRVLRIMNSRRPLFHVLQHTLHVLSDAVATTTSSSLTTRTTSSPPTARALPALPCILMRWLGRRRVWRRACTRAPPARGPCRRTSGPGAAARPDPSARPGTPRTAPRPHPATPGTWPGRSPACGRRRRRRGSARCDQALDHRPWGQHSCVLQASTAPKAERGGCLRWCLRSPLEPFIPEVRGEHCAGPGGGASDADRRRLQTGGQRCTGRGRGASESNNAASTSANQHSTSTSANQRSTSTSANQRSTSTSANQHSTSTSANQHSTSTSETSVDAKSMLHRGGVFGTSATMPARIALPCARARV